MIEIAGLKKAFHGLTVLKGIDLKIEDGDVFGLIGLSGAGKSTLLRCMSGLEPFDEGRVVINGLDAKEWIGRNDSELRRNTGMIFQQFALLERLTVYENVALPMRCWRCPKAQIDARVRELLALVGLEERRDAKPRELSGGQKQRVAIARALTMQPAVLFCDEATSALDPITTASILGLLRSINEDLGVTIVVVTHEMAVVKAICNKTAILDQGEILDVGNTEDVFLRGRHSLRSVLGEQIDGTGDVRDGDVKVIFRNEGENSHLLSRIASDAGIPYTVVWSSFDTYRGQVKGYYVLRVADEHRGPLEAWLEREGIETMEVRHDDIR